MESRSTGRLNRRHLLGLGALGASTAVLAACGGGSTKATKAASSAPASVAGRAAGAQLDAAVEPGEVYLSILNPDQTGKKDYPAYLPSNITIPSNSRVKFTITNFDDATPLPNDTFAKVTGTVGNVVTVEPVSASDPNVAGQLSTVSEVDPNQVAHTFTAPGLGQLNVPVLGTSRVRFAIDTGAPGTYVWQCLDPCGANGTGGGMAMEGYMRGTITVV
jgi:hypothetical protein